MPGDGRGAESYDRKKALAVHKSFITLCLIPLKVVTNEKGEASGAVLTIRY